MKNKKSMLIAFMLTTVILILSSSPVLAADIQAAYAKLPDDLLAEFDSIGNNESINVFVWIEDDSTAEYESIAANVAEPQFAQQNDTSTYSLHSVSETELTEEERLAQIQEMQNYIMQKRLIAQAIYLEDNTAKVAEISENLSGGEVVYVSKYSPLIIYNVTKSQAVEIAMTDCVISLDRGNVKGENSATTASQIIGAPTMETSGYTGQGVMVGMIETAYPDKTLSCFAGLENRIHVSYDKNAVYSEYDKSHASLVAAILMANDVGVAKGISHLLCGATDTNSDMVINVEQMLSQGVNVINFSWADEMIKEYNIRARWLEHVVYEHSVHCVVASGNKYVTGVAGIGMAYNVITVGATNDYNNLYVSDYNKGSSYYAENVYANKPDICAPGVGIEVITDGNHILLDSYNTGTSFAAPYVTGSVAMLCSMNPTLLDKPALVKSILCTSVNRTVRNYATDDSEYRQYGSGILNVSNARVVVGLQYYFGGTINSSSAETYYMNYYFTAGQTISVSLSYLKETTLPANEHNVPASVQEEALANVNLYICKKSQPNIANAVASCTSSRNNLKKINYTVEEAGEYIIIIACESGTLYDTVEFGLSWLV